MGFLGIERVTAVDHTSVISLVKQVGENLPDAYKPDCIPEVGKNENFTYIVNKLDKLEAMTDFNLWALAIDFVEVEQA